MELVESKTCKGCGVTRPISLFPYSSRSKDGLSPRCRYCVSLYYRERRKRLKSAVKSPCVYVLVDPRDSRIRYVGKTNWPEERFKQHLTDIRLTYTSNDNKKAWVRELLALGLKPLMIILEQCTDDTVDHREWYWLALLKKAGADLLNMNMNGATSPDYPDPGELNIDL